MDIKSNSANIVSITRIFVAFVSVGLLFVNTTSSYVWSVVLAIIAFSMDAVDGYLARKFAQASQLGAVLDIMGDRIIESIYWIVFAVLGWISVIFPIICVTRAFVTDNIRSIALTKGMTPFGMQTTQWGKFICASKFMKTTYAVAKVAAFVILIIANTPNIPTDLASTLNLTGIILAWIAIIFCVVRAVPVVAECGKLFNNDK
ncbi:CDP-alcohol phosphatidyltransferase family protein [bacterium]|nr:CDP-alcohol phosphatidyltransferase family protein [bacterium]